MYGCTMGEISKMIAQSSPVSSSLMDTVLAWCYFQWQKHALYCRSVDHDSHQTPPFSPFHKVHTTSANLTSLHISLPHTIYRLNKISCFPFSHCASLHHHSFGFIFTLVFPRVRKSQTLTLLFSTVGLCFSWKPTFLDSPERISWRVHSSASSVGTIVKNTRGG